MSPFPFFQQVRQIGVLCVVDVAPGQAAAAPDESGLCGLAVAELAGLIGAGGPPVTALAPNDGRIAAPDTLVVLLHATIRAGTGPMEAGGGTVLAMAASLYRAGATAGAPPFFAAPPQAVVAAGDGVAAGELRDALHRLLGGIARALLANR